MLEIKEVLRLWLGGAAHKRIAAQVGLNVKTVRRHVAAAQAGGVSREAGPEALDDGLIAAVVGPTR
jgi:predicted transcriptional regulator